MALVDVNGNLINGKAFPGPIRQVEKMLGKPISIISKLELSGLICSQYQAIETLVEALSNAVPDHPLIKDLARTKPVADNKTGTGQDLGPWQGEGGLAKEGPFPGPGVSSDITPAKDPIHGDYDYE
jgi:hypothetical protein